MSAYNVKRVRSLRPPQFRVHDAFAWRLLQGVVYTKSLQTGWKPRAKYRAMREDAHQDFRDKFHIICEGDNLPPPVSPLTK